MTVDEALEVEASKIIPPRSANEAMHVLAAEVRRLREDVASNRRDALDMESRWRGAESLCVSLKYKLDELEAEIRDKVTP